MNQTIESALRDLASVMAKLRAPNDIHGLFFDLLTPTERQALALRWLICQRLVEGVPQRAIAQEFRVSLCKITRGSSELRRDGSVARRILEARKAHPRT